MLIKLFFLLLNKQEPFTGIWRFVYQHRMHGHNVGSREALYIFQNLREKEKKKNHGKSDAQTGGTNNDDPYEHQDDYSLKKKKFVFHNIAHKAQKSAPRNHWQSRIFEVNRFLEAAGNLTTCSTRQGDVSGRS